MSDAALMRHLQRLIAAQGPISVAQFMAEALAHPEHGYYTTRDPFGAGGDFVTAPEVSQMFGELIGAWCADVWQQMGRPESFRLVELGPGRGTLMSDALRATRSVDGFHDAVALHLVEVSPILRKRQAAMLGAYTPAWHGSFTEVPDGPLIAVANELFDALPVHQFQYVDRAWHERLIDVGEDGDSLKFVLGPAAVANDVLALERPGDAVRQDAVREICPSGVALARDIASRIGTHTGVALIVDYGYDRPGFGDTVQAVRGHEPLDILAAPGDSDLCAHVDFPALLRAARGACAATWGPVTQAMFLEAIGLGARTQALKQTAPDDRAEIDAAVARLTDPRQMGSLFKVLAMTSAGLRPAGFPA